MSELLKKLQGVKKEIKEIREEVKPKTETPKKATPKPRSPKKSEKKSMTLDHKVEDRISRIETTLQEIVNNQSEIEQLKKENTELKILLSTAHWLSYKYSRTKVSQWAKPNCKEADKLSYDRLTKYCKEKGIIL